MSLFFVSNVSAVESISTGDLVKGPFGDAVYFIDGAKKHIFPDVKTFNSWHFNFSNVKSVSVSTLDMYTTGAPITFRPGIKLITHPNTTRVYAVTSGGVLHWIKDEETALALYGLNWADRVQDVHELTFGQYAINHDACSAGHLEGTLLQKKGDERIYYHTGKKIRLFEGGGGVSFNKNGFRYEDIIIFDDLDKYFVGDPILTNEYGPYPNYGNIPGSPPAVVTQLTYQNVVYPFSFVYPATQGLELVEFTEEPVINESTLARVDIETSDYSVADQTGKGIAFFVVNSDDLFASGWYSGGTYENMGNKVVGCNAWNEIQTVSGYNPEISSVSYDLVRDNLTYHATASHLTGQTGDSISLLEDVLMTVNISD